MELDAQYAATQGQKKWYALHPKQLRRLRKVKKARVEAWAAVLDGNISAVTWRASEIKHLSYPDARIVHLTERRPAKPKAPRRKWTLTQNSGDGIVHAIKGPALAPGETVTVEEKK